MSDRDDALSVEDLIAELETVTFQRDRYEEDLERARAERDRYFAEVEELDGRLREAGLSGRTPPDDEAAPDPEAVGDAPTDPGAAAGGSVPPEVHDEIVAERDGYLADLQRVSAEFQNFRKQTERRNAEVASRAAADLAEKLLGVLDACDAALAQGASDVEPIHNALVQTLEKAGLAVIGRAEEPFDPNCHEAVMREEGDEDEQVVAEVLRTGYAWDGRTLRPAMVKVRG